MLQNCFLSLLNGRLIMYNGRIKFSDKVELALVFEHTFTQSFSFSFILIRPLKNILHKFCGKFTPKKKILLSTDKQGLDWGLVRTMIRLLPNVFM